MPIEILLPLAVRFYLFLCKLPLIYREGKTGLTTLILKMPEKFLVWVANSALYWGIFSIQGLIVSQADLKLFSRRQNVVRLDVKQDI